uniref:Uncharacterized protein n=1 Tax=Moniliophthora roreri TaxID=221103 RepID=A0A0W0F242_MONRR
MHKTRLLH